LIKFTTKNEDNTTNEKLIKKQICFDDIKISENKKPKTNYHSKVKQKDV
jgi:hypothetical protein